MLIVTHFIALYLLVLVKLVHICVFTYHKLSFVRSYMTLENECNQTKKINRFARRTVYARRTCKWTRTTVALFWRTNWGFQIASQLLLPKFLSLVMTVYIPLEREVTRPVRWVLLAPELRFSNQHWLKLSDKMKVQEKEKLTENSPLWNECAID